MNREEQDRPALLDRNSIILLLKKIVEKFIEEM
jgi:hypothetical protein